ncbi:FAD-binding oxidoreductase [OM182 bacterium]|jgi:FAD/FMN-containing dehydrogenase|nr:FAD-binding oxidoreductase [OM182 bacterium]
MKIAGWGNYPALENAKIFRPVDADSIQRTIGASDFSTIARGNGRSYGDSSLSNNIISTLRIDRFIEINEDSTLLRCEAGLTLNSVLEAIVPKGRFLPVLPGADLVTVGGAIASDVHGKNHHQDGSFCDHVVSITVIVASGEIIECSRTNHADIFHATCGGMGLTGVLIAATLKLISISSNKIKQSILPASDLGRCIALIDQNAQSKYSVAWLDARSRDKNFGRSILFLGHHLDEHGTPNLEHPQRTDLSIPFSPPSWVLNRHISRAFNEAYFRLQKQQQTIVNYRSFFFPLERIKNWNSLYGARGFLQYQLVVPTAEGIKETLTAVANSGECSYLTVLKKFRGGNENLLSFPQEGYTLTMDFKHRDSIFPLLDKLDNIVLDQGGRLYCAKDSRMSKKMFQATYPRWQEFIDLKTRLDPTHRFRSLQSERLGLNK